MKMKVEPAEEYDQEVYSFLKEIKYELKKNNNGVVSYIDRYAPYNKNFWKTQYFIDKLTKAGVFEVLNCCEAKGGINPDFQSVDFSLKVNLPAFNKLYEKYTKAFEISISTKLVIYKNGEAQLTANGKTYKTKFNKGRDYFRVLMLLSTNKDNLLTFGEIAHTMKEKPDRETGDERRARDAIQYIKDKKFGYKGKDFIQTERGFRLVCDVEIKSQIPHIA